MTHDQLSIPGVIPGVTTTEEPGCPSHMGGKPCQKPDGHPGRCANSTGTWDRDRGWTW